MIPTTPWSSPTTTTSFDLRTPAVTEGDGGSSAMVSSTGYPPQWAGNGQLSD